jgi:hypothetical protein
VRKHSCSRGAGLDEYDFERVALWDTETDLAQLTPDRFGIAGTLHR